jgi:hypothetical protein
MSQLTIQLSDKADALIAQLQKEIFNRRRKKVSPAGVVETLVESGAKSQSDKRFATSWTNLIADIERAARLADAHGSKPANLTDAEWAMVLNHRSRTHRAGSASRTGAAGKPAAKPAPKPTAKKTVARPSVVDQPPVGKLSTAKTTARNPVRKKAVHGTTLKPRTRTAGNRLMSAG